jgi:hypothetical protein
MMMMMMMVMMMMMMMMITQPTHRDAGRHKIALVLGIAEALKQPCSKPAAATEPGASN